MPVLKKSWQDRYSFPELHKEFPEMVDNKGKGWLSQHVKALCKFSKSNPDLVDTYARKDCEILRKSFTTKLRKKVVHYQGPIFSPSTDQVWSIFFDSVIADALELGPLQDKKLSLTKGEHEKLAAYKPKGMPIEMFETLVAYYKANKLEVIAWAVLPVTNFDAFFGGSGFSHKYLSKIPKELVQREKQSYGVSRYKVDLLLLQDRQPENMPDFPLELLRSGSPRSDRSQSLQIRIPKFGFLGLAQFAISRNIQHQFCPKFQAINKGLAIRENIDLPRGTHIRLEESSLFPIEGLAQGVARFDRRTVSILRLVL